MPDINSSPEKPTDWAAQVEAACKRQGITTREGIVFNEETGEVGDAMAWELEAD